MQEVKNDTCGGGVGVGGSVGGGRRRDALLAALDDASRRLSEATPALLALKNSYHGRTAAALAVTANASYGDMFPRTAVDVRFIARDSLDEDVERALDELRIEGLALPPAPSSTSSSVSLFVLTHRVVNRRVGAGGGRVCAELLAPDVASLLLVHREPLDASPKFRKAYRTVCTVAGSTAASTKIEATHALERIADCDVVINGTNSTQKFLEPHLLKRNAVVLDRLRTVQHRQKSLVVSPGRRVFPRSQRVSAPRPEANISAYAHRGRGRLRVHGGDGGAGDGDGSRRRGERPTRRRAAALDAERLPPQEPSRGSHSVGALSREGVLATLAIADRVGIGIGHVKRMTQAEAAVAHQQKAAAAAAAPGSFSRL